MSVPSDLVNQSLFTAALFLLFISIPKLILLSITYAFRFYTYRNRKDFTEKYASKIIKQRNIIQELQKMADDPVHRINQEMKDWRNFNNDIRDPIVEGSVSLVIIWLVYPAFTEISIWLNAAFFIIIIVILSSILLLRLAIRDINLIPVTEKDNKKT
jgi:hypothetical protein